MRQLVERLGRRGLRAALKMVFWLRYRQRHAWLSLERLAELQLVVPPEVFNPALFGSSSMLANYLRRELSSAGGTALDLGCGSGLLGLTLARAGWQVTATDINPQAVWISAVNARLNGLMAQHTALEGSLYEPVAGRRFDLIVMNPPYYAGQPMTLIERAFKAGPGLEVLTAMLIEVGRHLTPSGQALAVVSSTIELGPILRQVEEAGLTWRVVARRRYWAEWHLIYQLQPVASHDG